MPAEAPPAPADAPIMIVGAKIGGGTEPDFQAETSREHHMSVVYVCELCIL